MCKCAESFSFPDPYRSLGRWEIGSLWVWPSGQAPVGKLSCRGRSSQKLFCTFAHNILHFWPKDLDSTDFCNGKFGTWASRCQGPLFTLYPPLQKGQNPHWQPQRTVSAGMQQETPLHLKYGKIVKWPGLRPRPHWRSLQRSSDT